METEQFIPGIKWRFRFQVPSRLSSLTWNTWRWMHHEKHCEYINKNKDDSPNALIDKSSQVSYQKFRQKSIRIRLKKKNSGYCVQNIARASVIKMEFSFGILITILYNIKMEFSFGILITILYNIKMEFSFGILITILYNIKMEFSFGILITILYNISAYTVVSLF